MADGNELDDDVEIDDVVYETEDEDGVISFLLPMAGFTTDIQKAWAEGVSKKIGTLDRELRLTRTQLSNAEVIANNAVALASGQTDVDGEGAVDAPEEMEAVDPPAQPSAPQVTSRMGNLEIFWDGADFEGTPMPAETAVVNVYAVETALLPETPDWDLVDPYTTGDFEVPDGDVILLSDPCDSAAGWTWGSGVSLNTTTFRSAPGSILAQGTESLVMTRTMDFTQGVGPLTWRAWVKNLGTDPLALTVDFGWDTYELDVVMPGPDWTQVAIPGLPSDQVYSSFSVLSAGGYSFHIDDIVVSQTLDVEAPDEEEPPETPATAWPPRTIGSIASTVTGGNVIFSDLAYNTEYTVWFIAQDSAGNRSVASERATSSVRPLVDTDVIGQVIAGANIVDDSITASDKIIGNTITGGLIQALAIDTGHLKANAVTADKVAAGSITTAKLDSEEIWGNNAWLNTLRAGVIEVDMLKPNVGEQLNISANQAVEIIVGRQDQADINIAQTGAAATELAIAAQNAAEDAAEQALAANEAAVGAQTAADEAAEIAGGAQGAAEEAAGVALVAQTMAAENMDRLDIQQAVFRVVQEGAVVASVDSAYELKMKPNRVEIVQNDEVVSYWEGARMVVNEAVLNRVMLGNHMFEKDLIVQGRTVVRPVIAAPVLPGVPSLPGVVTGG